MSSAKIMIVEDNTTMAEDCSECLMDAGYTVTSIAASGEEAINRAKVELPDAVLMDIYLSGKMDGIKAAEQIYTRFNIPVVFLSAYSDHNLLDRAKQVGSFGYLIKPFDERELTATLEMALYKAKMEKEREQMQIKLDQVQKMKSIGILAGGLAHDFNNLLFVISGNIGLVGNDLQCSKLASQNLENAQKACSQAKELAKKLIVFSKGAHPVKEKINIGELVKKSVISVFKESSVQVDFFIPDNINEIKIDIAQIKQVVYNIVLNAKEAMHNKGIFKVNCKNINITEKDNLTLTPGKYIEISFKDQGCGMSKDNLGKVFDPYFSTKDMGVDKGQGLGLAICYSIITRHNGMIVVDSELGAGSIFTIYLPTFSSEKPDLKRSKEISVNKGSVKQSAKGKKILLMDDEEMIRDFMGQVLNKSGYDVETCIEGKEAVDRYNKAMELNIPFDVVILDLTNKFGMGGQQTMKRLLELDPYVKGIVITGYSDDPVVTNFQAYGFSGCLVKPSTKDELSKVINEVAQMD